MSGICAGVPEVADPGTVIVADPCWEYQAGKWAQDKFEMEPYSASIRPTFRTHINQIILQDPHGLKLKEDLGFEELRYCKIMIAPLATGSAVVANKQYFARVGDQHRKMAGLEMEMYGVYKAAELSTSLPLYFGAKTVVDAGDSDKGDTLHVYGSIVSARFIVGVIKSVLLGEPRVRAELYGESAIR